MQFWSGTAYGFEHWTYQVYVMTSSVPLLSMNWSGNQIFLLCSIFCSSCSTNYSMSIWTNILGAVLDSIFQMSHGYESSCVVWSTRVKCDCGGGDGLSSWLSLKIITKQVLLFHASNVTITPPSYLNSQCFTITIILDQLIGLMDSRVFYPH